MQQSDNLLQSLSQCFLQTLAPNPEPRKQAEAFLRQAADLPGYGIAVLQLVSGSTLDEQIRQAAAVNFKNHVKYRWEISDPDAISTFTPIPDPEKEQIKGLILGLMLTAPQKIQSQLSEALASISSHDFPQKWQSLLPELVSSLSSSSDYKVIHGILQTVNSIFKKFKYQYKSSELYRDLKYCLNGFAAPLLDIFLKTGQLIASNQDLPAVLKPLFESQRLCCRIFYSLNFQELPEFFEDHLDEWMGEFHKYLTYTNPLLKETDPEKESVVDQLKAAICENINLYMEKNEEEFKDYLTGFATDVWSLLMDVSLLPSYDRLATTAIRFLTTVSKSVHHSLFSSAETLKQICECIVIPNVRIRGEDEELFEMDHVEYIRRDMEGSDTDTRRRMACELVKGLSVHYKEQVTSMFSTYVKGMIDKYAANPIENWKEKDCAIYLVVSLAPRQVTGGATGTDLVNVEQFFVSQIVPELQSQDINDQPLLKADALKFVTTFRSQIPKAMALAVFPNVIRFIVAESCVLHSYAAGCVEKLLLLKNDRQPRFAPADVAPFLQPLLANLFSALKLPESQENAYVMKCIMRVFSSADIGPIATQCLAQLAAILGQVCKNPTNPSFNHYLFEAVAAVVRKSFERDPEVVAAFESILFPVIQVVLQDDITEFAPYVFQILAQLIESRRPPLPSVYISLLAPSLNMTLWQRPANVPALVRLLQAYLQKAPEEIIHGNQLTQVLGVFQKLIYSRSTDHQGFFILNTVVENLSYQTLSPYIGQIWNVLFYRLQNQRTVKFIKSLIVFSSLSVVKYGHTVVAESINAIQPNLFLMILEQVWIPNLSFITGDLECKLCSVAATKLLSESPVLLADSAVATWGKFLNSVVTLLVRPEEERVNEETDVPDLDEFVGYATVYAQLHNAGKREEDPVKEVKDPKEYLVNSLMRLSSQYPGKFPSIILQHLEAPNQTGLAQLCSTYRRTLV
ncbi:hypothetical protein O6H91_23G056900 [Diphasiastrum complanatum]|uniref:Uncharacterized protein n=4 Tax=Diphasiastrum complanatum TaxID=34168 RepID=A0ACC2ACA6_DIPCM|nr:hypothetical protein O6H91_23G056900 [Diphasiastrum complanatum]KAJ7514728.1 hypothetical protein O6H91_23G056900 [Diphasiastrum complanatum]KAJ7514729.1 hypothetical protein O6H91_23G056900 [Diphasiastrum complanatum]KAJ7514730.1 hypothetical protein O6H91_23G056900 [Diphasiastrum complanatum]